jgi:hypothetical protein
VLALGILVGIAAAVGGAVGAVARLALRLTAAPSGRATAASVAAGAAAAATWLVFAFDWLVYSVSEGGPSYYPFSDYVEYRRAQDDGGVAIGLGYALLAGLLVAATAALPRRVGRWWGLAAVLAAAGAIALPVAVPAALPRFEYGKDPVFRLSREPYEDSVTGQLEVCFLYGIERPGLMPPTEKAEPELCLELERNATARRLIRNPAPIDPDKPSVYDPVEQLNESGTRPYDQVDDLGTDGLEVVQAEWPNAPSSLAQPPISRPPAAIVSPAGDAETRTNLLRLEGHMEACRAVEFDYVVCATPERLRAIGMPPGAGPGLPNVAAASVNGYMIEAQSTRGVWYRLTRQRPGGRERTCSQPGTGRCPVGGRW